MTMHPINETQIEWVARTVPEGDKCGGCGRISGGKCDIWKHHVDSNSEKCPECLKTLKEQLWGIKQLKKESK